MQNASTDKNIIKFDPWLIEAIHESMGRFPSSPRDLSKIKSNGRVEILAAQCTELQENAIVGEAILAEWNDVVLLDYFAVFSEFRSTHTLPDIPQTTLRIYIQALPFPLQKHLPNSPNSAFHCVAGRNRKTLYGGVSRR